MSAPGGRYAYIFALADRMFPKRQALPRTEDAREADGAGGVRRPGRRWIRRSRRRVDEVTQRRRLTRLPKKDFESSPLRRQGSSPRPPRARRRTISDAHLRDLRRRGEGAESRGTYRSYISGGCGLNCDWNFKWREMGHFSSVFVPPNTDDSGSALGSAIDARLALTGEPYTLDWDVYSGLEFERDYKAGPRRLGAAYAGSSAALAAALGERRVVAWVQGRWEIGLRALGNRSLLADASDPAMKDKLNRINSARGTGGSRPDCRLEDAGSSSTSLRGPLHAVLPHRPAGVRYRRSRTWTGRRGLTDRRRAARNARASTTS